MSGMHAQGEVEGELIARRFRVLEDGTREFVEEPAVVATTRDGSMSLGQGASEEKEANREEEK
jgi:hypothetical protein